ncbi:hypothetical protein BV25DRAFT_1184134 [Artomyces pyxidatus]|uniref:Uncharacterized protein n=1 Tax=Artomyces pyxidatus TaxID=48021 RepID=A0ACB8SST9_9AGAM|nr:hypothetical protein BV25DRAFT_1184134 [Artomyces pyxidatus]
MRCVIDPACVQLACACALERVSSPPVPSAWDFGRGIRSGTELDYVAEETAVVRSRGSPDETSPRSRDASLESRDSFGKSRDACTATRRRRESS